MKPVAVLATGMITGVGLDAPSSCAAIRCAIDNFQETRFVDRQGEWIVGSEVPLDPPLRGRPKLVRMASSAIAECLPALGETPPEDIPLLLCVAEQARPGRFDGLDGSLIGDISSRLNVAFSKRSLVIENGAVGGVQAIEAAMRLINDQTAPYVLVAGVDTFLVAATLMALDQSHRLLTPSNSNGLIPGEGAAAVLMGTSPTNGTFFFVCEGVGFGVETATINSDQPLRAQGLSEAMKAALQAASRTFDDLDYRITNASGEQYGFKEAALAIARCMTKTKEEFDIWHPADCMGEIGAAHVPSLIAVAKTAAEKAYAKGSGVMLHAANDDGQRGVIVCRQLDLRETNGK